jgi:hypothetical protein
VSTVTDEIIVMNLTTLRRKYGANGVKAIRSAIKRR